MELRETTLDILELLEMATGYPAQVTGVGTLDTVATVKMARGPVATHHVMVNPNADMAPDYLICHGCGVILRLFACPPEARHEPAPDPSGRAAVERLLRDPKGPVHRYRLDDARTESLRDKLYGGLMLQLRTTPIGLRVDQWLRDSYGELTDLQEESARQRVEADLAMLEPDVRAITPPLPLTASLAMNAAYAEYWSRTLGEPDLVAPYRMPGSYRDGRALMRIWDRVPDDPAEDRALIDAWARLLGIGEWYGWRPYPAPARGE